MVKTIYNIFFFTARNPYIEKLQCRLEQSQGREWWSNMTETEKIQLILDSTKITGLSDSLKTEVCNISRGLCYTLHSARYAK